MLGRDHHGVDPLGTVPVVLDGDLGLAVGAQKGQPAGVANLGELPDELVGQHDRQGHQLVRLLASEAEHQALVPRAASVHAHCDIGGLLVHVGLDSARVGIEQISLVVVADLSDRLASDSLQVNLRIRVSLAGKHAEIRRHERFAGDAAVRVLRQDLIQHGVRDLVAQLVGMALCYGLRGK